VPPGPAARAERGAVRMCVTVCVCVVGGWCRAQVWVCLLHNYTAAECPAPPDRACFVWIEPARSFAYWGRNSYLNLVRE
jgi:hypothetical protein